VADGWYTMTRRTLHCMKSLAIVFLLLHGTSGNGLTLYVAVHGSNDASGLTTQVGSRSGPLAGIEEAIKRATQYHESRKTKPVAIALLDGVYRISAPIRIVRSVSGLPTPPLRIYAVNPGGVRISGGRELTGSRPLRQGEAPRIPLSSRPAVRVFDFSATPFMLHDLRRHGWNNSAAVANTDLYFNERRMRLARWPKSGYAVIAALSAESRKAFYAMPTRPDRLTIDPGIFAVGYFSYDWAMEAMPVLTSKNSSGRIVLSDEPSFPLRIGGRFFLENVPSQLASPGDWVLDAKNGHIFFWPPSDDVSSAEITDAESLITLDGASHVELDGLDFELARGPAIVIRDSEDIRVENATIRNVGGRAIDASGRRIKIVNCRIHAVGDGGVYVSSGDRGTLTPGESVVAGNDIYDYSRWNYSYRPGIQLSGVGNVAERNRIHDATHMAVKIEGNDNVVRSNEIYDVVQDSSDAGAIYMGRDWTQRGNVISGNFLHDIGVPSRDVRGIYLDDQISGTYIASNFFLRVSKAIYVGGGRDNVIVGNVFIDSAPAMSIDDRGVTWQAEWVSDPNGPLRRNLKGVPYLGSAYGKYPHLRDILGDDVGAPKYNVFRNNAMVRSGCPALGAVSIGTDPWVESSGNVCVNGSGAYFHDANTPTAEGTGIYDVLGTQSSTSLECMTRASEPC
jgi:hypothetical protein